MNIRDENKSCGMSLLEGTGKGKKGVRVGKKSEGFAVFQTLRVFAMSLDRKIRELATS